MFDNAFFGISLITTVLDGGKCGIMNHYNKSGQIRDISAFTRTMFFEFSTLKDQPITEQDIPNIIAQGKKVITESDVVLDRNNMAQYVHTYHDENVKSTHIEQVIGDKLTPQFKHIIDTNDAR